MLDKLTLEHPLAIVGDEDVVLGLGALGFKIYPLKIQNEFGAILAEIIQNKTGICLVEENIYQAQEETINNYRNLPLPIFIPFSKSARNDLLENIVKQIRLKATGVINV
jgi:vacuolar-type H+-ATPase subunit F/Vma7